MEYSNKRVVFGPWNASPPSIIAAQNRFRCFECRIREANCPSKDNRIHRSDSRHHRHIAIGFDVRHESWGQGIGTEMVTAVCAYAFDHLGVQRIEAHVMKGNRPSQRLLESIGFDNEGVLKRRMYKDGSQHDVMIYALIAHNEIVTH